LVLSGVKVASKSPRNIFKDFSLSEHSAYLSCLGRADERTRTAFLLITSVRSVSFISLKPGACSILTSLVGSHNVRTVTTVTAVTKSSWYPPQLSHHRHTNQNARVFQL
jgi:hypothetical protein